MQSSNSNFSLLSATDKLSATVLDNFSINSQTLIASRKIITLSLTLFYSSILRSHRTSFQISFVWIHQTKDIIIIVYSNDLKKSLISNKNTGKLTSGFDHNCIGKEKQPAPRKSTVRLVSFVQCSHVHGSVR